MPRLITLAAVAALTLGVAACGSSGSSSSSAAPAPSSSSAAAPSSSSSAAPSSSSSAAATSASGAGATGASGSVAIAADASGALKFTTKTLTAKAGTVHISFTNQAPEGHNFTLVKGSGSAQIGATPTFSGGTKTLTVKLSPGTYTYYCSVPGHRMAGMQGTLTVKSS